MKRMLAVSLLSATLLIASGPTLPPNPPESYACAVDMNDYPALFQALWVAVAWAL